MLSGGKDNVGGKVVGTKVGATKTGGVRPADTVLLTSWSDSELEAASWVAARFRAVGLGAREASGLRGDFWGFDDGEWMGDGRPAWSPSFSCAE
jgi:hypothetical protein